MATSADIGQKLDAERRSMDAWLKQHRTEDGGFTQANEFLTEFNTRNETLAKMQGEYETALKVESVAAQNEAKLGSQGRMVVPDSKPESKFITDADGLDRAFKSAMRDNAPSLKALADGQRGTVRFELPVEAKTLVSLTHHYPPATRAQTTPSALYYNSVEDLFGQGSTDSNNIEYFIQSTDTDNTSAIAEGSAVTDSAFAWTKVTDEVEIIQAWVPVTREFLNDNAGMQSMVQGMLADRLDKYVSKQLMYGTGSTPELWGVTVRTNFASQAKGTDPVFDTIMKGIDKVTVAGDAVPDAVVLHPTDWMNLALTRTTDGIYILGNPGNPPATPTIWGLPVRVTSTVAAAAGTGCVGAFKSMAQIFNNGGVVVEASTEHSTYFTERKVALAISRRLSVANYRPTAFVKLTGL
jgi:HK97 family phage major capsid protein